MEQARYAQIGALKLECQGEGGREGGQRKMGTDLLLEVPLAFSQGT